MKNFVITLFYCIVFENFYGIFSSEDSECSYLKSHKVSPRECCDFPIVYINNTTIRKCFKKCPSIKSDEKYKTDEEKRKDDECCLVRCFYQVEQILRSNGSIDNKKMIENFRTRNGSELSEEWEKIVDSSVKGCAERYPKSTTIENCFPSYHRLVLKCSYIESFLNCVDYVQTEKCIALKKTVEYCINSTDMTLEEWSVFFE